MRWLVVAVSLGLGLGLSNVAAGAALKKKKHHVVRGTVVEVLHQNQDKGAGVIKVRVHRRKKNAVVGVAKPRSRSHIVTINVQDKTQFQKVLRYKNYQVQHAAAAFRDVQKGKHVHISVHSKPHKAHRVNIVTHIKGPINPSLGKIVPIKPVKPVVRRR